MRWFSKEYFLNNILLIFLFALTVRFITAFLSNGLFCPEAWEYEDIAVNLYNGKGFLFNFIGKDYYAYSTPLYPIACAIIYKIIGHNQSAVIALQIILSSLQCIIIYLIVERIFKKPVSVVAALLTAIHPGLIILSSLKLHAFTFDSFFISLTLLFFMFLIERLTLARALACGITYGLCALTRSTITPFLPFGILWVILKNKNNLKQVVKCSFILLLCAVIIVGAWSLRNLRVFHKAIPITTVSGEVFWRGNNINASGTSYTKDGVTVLESDPVLFKKIVHMNELERYYFFKSEAWKFIKSYPLRFVKLTIKKFYYFWWFSPDMGKFYPPKPFQLYKLGYLFILLFAAVGFLKKNSCLKKNSEEKIYLILLIMFIVSSGQSFFYVEGRHRLAIEPLLLIFSACGLFYTQQKLKLCLKTKI